MTGLEKAIYIAKFLESKLPDKMHIGLTGGTLYKEGERKDIDFVVYSHKCYETINTSLLAGLLILIGLKEVVNYGRVIKCKFVSAEGWSTDVDIIVPESETGEYVEQCPTLVDAPMIHPHNGDEVKLNFPNFI